MDMKRHLALPVTIVLAGCLSIDAIPVESERDAGKPVSQRDSSVDDAATADAWAEDSAVDAEPDAGESLARPVCAPGVSELCDFVPSTENGRISHGTISGEYIYWLEHGTTDQYNNYLYDGALVRMRVGDWKPENVLSGLDMYNESSRTIITKYLRASSEYVVWSDELGPYDYLAQGDSSRTVRTGHLHVNFLDCRLVPAHLICTSTWDQPNFYRLDTQEMSRMGSGVGRVALVDSLIYEENGRELVRTDLNTGLSWSFETNVELLDALPGDRLIVLLSDARLAVGQIESEETPRWHAIGGPGTYVGTRGEWLYWIATNSPKEVRRSRLDGTGDELLGKIDSVGLDWVGARDYRAAFNVSFGKDGLLVVHQTKFIHRFTYVPFPAD